MDTSQKNVAKIVKKDTEEISELMEEVTSLMETMANTT